jgi:hypothetical protein
MFLLRQGSRTDYNYKEYYLDSADELSKIDVAACCPGSVAYVIATGALYILNTSKQ